MSTGILNVGDHRNRAPCRGGMAGWRLARVVAFMKAHLADDIAVEDLAQVSGLSRAQFFRAFRQSTGLTPNRYLTGLRLERARDLIEQGWLGPAEAACGVRLGASGFAALFRRRFGMTPRTFASGRLRPTSVAGEAPSPPR